jgi:hypothetical protein
MAEKVAFSASVLSIRIQAQNCNSFRCPASARGVEPNKTMAKRAISTKQENIAKIFEIPFTIFLRKLD